MLLAKVANKNKGHSERPRLPAMLTAVVLLAFPLFGCQGSQPGPVSGAGGTLVVGMPNTPTLADPAFYQEFVDGEMIANTYDALFAYKYTSQPDGTYHVDLSGGVTPVVGQLAESWTESPDHLTHTITLRSGVKSANGNVLTTEDVRWTFQRYLETKANGPFYLGGIGFPDMTHFKKVDDRTFQIITDKPNVLFYKILAIPPLGIQDSVEGKKHITATDPWASDWFKTNTAGFGPYTVSEWTPGQQVVLSANPNYWGGDHWGGKPYWSKVVLKEIPSDANRAALIQAGTIDVAEVLPVRQWQNLQSNSSVKIYTFKSTQTGVWLTMTTTTPPFNDVRVRQAMCYAIPYQQIIQNVTLNTGVQQKSPLPLPYQYYTEQFWPYNTDIQKAKDLLTAAGHPNGIKMTLAFSTAEPEDQPTATILKDGLAQAGIDVSLNLTPLAAFNAGLFTQKFPTTVTGAGAYVPDAAYALRIWFYGNNNFLDFSAYNNPTVNQKLDQLTSTYDDAQRQQLTYDLQKQITNDAPICPMFNPGLTYVTKSNLKGLIYVTYSALIFNLMRRG